MKHNELIKFCRYYKGQKENPFVGKEQQKAMLWSIEKTWVEDTASAIHAKEATASQSSILDEYLAVGLKDFEKFDDTPIMLKAIIFNRYAQNTHTMLSAVDGFKKLYYEYYS